VRWLLLLALIACSGASLAAPPASAEEEPAEEAAEFKRAPDPKERPGPDADLFAQGVELQRKRKWIAARRKFWKLIDKYPDSPYAPEAEDRSGPNAFLGLEPMGAIGPQARRIDVALMADGYRIKEQKSCNKAFRGQLDVLLGEPLYAVYRPYFNFWQFNLASEDKGVDEPLPPEADEELQERLRKRRRKKRGPKQYSTALDCKAAGPQGQVWANPRRVWHYLQYLDNHDSLAIVFAQMGRLGMGGMGIATTGPRGVVVHEFGHAFVGLLDEYANNPGEPSGFVNGPNATTSPDKPPWQHFLDAKVPGVGVYEGGATFQKGVWRPAPGCAMNSGGGSPYCPVCREAAVLRIYERVSPIDEVWPKEDVVEVAAGSNELPEFRVLPMAPVGHQLKVRWILGRAPEITPPAAEEIEEEDGPGDERLDPFERRLRKLRRARDAKDGTAKKRRGLPTPIGFRIGTARRAQGTGGTPLPKGERVSTKTRRVKGVGKVHLARMPMALPVGRHLLTVIVWDPTPKKRGAAKPWVLKDERGLLEDRRQWLIEVGPRAAPPADGDK
jgi:hypothetical protein